MATYSTILFFVSSSQSPRNIPVLGSYLSGSLTYIKLSVSQYNTLSPSFSSSSYNRNLLLEVTIEPTAIFVFFNDVFSSFNSINSTYNVSPKSILDLISISFFLSLFCNANHSLGVQY